ncbi:MAG: hypothetical protein GXX91_14195, partial [Verrucomicrobiaceae bacterium]|nr:hypothetical protein [Verrucomicrobiaceae bacterium]
MRPLRLVPACLVLIVLMFPLLPMSSPAAPRDAEWKQVEEHLAGALPQSAIEVLTSIEAAAREEKAWPELAKAVAYRIVAETRIQGKQPEEKIQLIEEALTDAPEEIAPILKTLLASAYWDYFQDNRWRLLQRTRTSETPGEDFETWDLPRLLREIDTRYRSALEKADALQEIPLVDFDTLLVTGNVPAPFRPTLYDFLAHEALAFYTAAEQVGAAPQDSFGFDAASPALGTMAEFLDWKPESTDSDSPTLRAVLLYQDLLRFHASDADPSARVLIDLERLEWAASEAVGDTAETRAREQLRALWENHADTEAGVAVAAALAERLAEAEEFVEARRIAGTATEPFPDSVFAIACRNLVKRIEARELRIGTEEVWNAAGAEIEITYRNITETHFRLVPREWTLSGDRWETPDNVDRDDILAALREDAVASWSVTLEKTEDYRSRTIRVPAPAEQKPGFYLLIASASDDFGSEDNQLSATTLWVSPLALITRRSPDGAEGFVLDALSGEPIAGAVVEVWRVDKNGRWSRDPIRKKTDAMGFFKEKAKVRPVLFLATHDGAAVTSGQMHLWSGGGKPDPLRTWLFTDRSIYR